MTDAVWVGVDVGGTKVLAGTVDADGAVTRTARRASPGRSASVPELEDALTLAVEAVAAGRPVAGVGLAAAGFVDGPGERVRFAPHLPWRDDPVRERLAARWSAPVVLENDATCAAVAETRLGAGLGAASVVMVTLGTGIGGGLVLDGRAFRGTGGMAGEFGHMTVQPDGHACPCGGRGCWEQYASGPALLRTARESWGSRPSVLEQWCDGERERLTAPMVSRAAAQGDPLARAAVDEVARWLGVGLADLVAALDPACVVVGGGLGSVGELLLAPARRELAGRLVGRGHRAEPLVLAARLGSRAGLVGAALLVREAQSRR